MFLSVITGISVIMLLVITLLSCVNDFLSNREYENEGLTKGTIWLMSLSVIFTLILNVMTMFNPMM